MAKGSSFLYGVRATLKSRYILLIAVLILLIPVEYVIGVYLAYNAKPLDLMSFLNQAIFLYFSLALAILGFLFVMACVGIVNWLLSKEKYVVQPFEVGGFDNRYNGQALSNLLIKEVMKIGNIKKMFNDEVACIKRKNNKLIINASELDKITVSAVNMDFGAISSPPGLKVIEELDIGPSGQDRDIVDLGTVGQGSVKISIGKLLLILRRFLNKSDYIITGSLQEFESVISLVIWKGYKNPISFECTCDPENFDEINESDKKDKIHGLIEELAFKISYNMQDKADVKTKTWQGHRCYIKMIENFCSYLRR